MGITRVITWACRLNFPSVVINSSENKDRMLMERIRITAFFNIRLSYRWAFHLLFVVPFSLSRLSKDACLLLVHGCLSCLVLSSAFYLIFILSYFAYLFCPSGCSKQEAMSLLQYFSRTEQSPSDRPSLSSTVGEDLPSSQQSQPGPSPGLNPNPIPTPIHNPNHNPNPPVKHSKP